MTYSQDCVNLVKRSEGLRLESYHDSGGRWTIGWGHTGPEVVEGLVWTLQEAEDALTCDLEAACARMLGKVTVPLTQGQIDALTDFVFNEGIGNFQSSMMLRLLNTGQYDAAAQQLVWRDASNNWHGWVFSKGQVMQGLVARRQAEQGMFLMPGEKVA